MWVFDTNGEGQGVMEQVGEAGGFWIAIMSDNQGKMKGTEWRSEKAPVELNVLSVFSCINKVS